MGRFFSLAAALAVAVLPLRADAQTRDISGKVTQAVVGTPIADVTVSIVGQQVGVRTNERGEFRMRVPSGEVALLARQLGFALGLLASRLLLVLFLFASHTLLGFLLLFARLLLLLLLLLLLICNDYFHLLRWNPEPYRQKVPKLIQFVAVCAASRQQLQHAAHFAFGSQRLASSCPLFLSCHVTAACSKL
mgnify:CR=1 FL=1